LQFASDTDGGDGPEARTSWAIVEDLEGGYYT
jgi:hypothetical protein